MRQTLTSMLLDLKNGLKKMVSIIHENYQLVSDYFNDHHDMEDQTEKEYLSKMRANDMAIRSLGNALESQSVKVLSLQAPVSRDLRLVISSFRMIYDVERASRDFYNAIVDIAKIEEENPDYFHKETELLMGSIENAKSLFSLFLEIYDRDVKEGPQDFSDVVEKTAALDDKIDQLHEDHSKNIIADAKSNKIQPDAAHYYLAAIRSVERMGDHVVNLIERTLYIQTGDKHDIK